MSDVDFSHVDKLMKKKGFTPNTEAMPPASPAGGGGAPAQGAPMPQGAPLPPGAPPGGGGMAAPMPPGGEMSPGMGGAVPGMSGGAGQGGSITLSVEELKDLLSELKGGAPSGEDSGEEGGDTEELQQRIKALETQLSEITNMLGALGGGMGAPEGSTPPVGGAEAPPEEAPLEVPPVGTTGENTQEMKMIQSLMEG